LYYQTINGSGASTGVLNASNALIQDEKRLLTLINSPDGSTSIPQESGPAHQRQRLNATGNTPSPELHRQKQLLRVTASSRVV